MVSKRRSLRTAVVGVFGAASVALAGTAVAVTPAADTVSPVAVVRQAVPAKAGITAKPSTSSVRAWQLFRVTGRTTGL
ncbi:hypothetical protein ACF08M_41230, partial [Streptomyces sp. NPDC015032]